MQDIIINLTKGKKTSPSIGFILENYLFYHFIEAVNDAFAIFLFELYRGEVGSEDGVKLLLITRGNEVYHWRINIPKLDHFARFYSQVINNHKLVTHQVPPITVVPFAPHCYIFGIPNREYIVLVVNGGLKV